MNDLETVELEQKHLTAMFTKNQEILSLHSQIKKLSSDNYDLIESLKSQNETLKQEINSAKEYINELQDIASKAQSKIMRMTDKFIELGVPYTE